MKSLKTGGKILRPLPALLTALTLIGGMPAFLQASAGEGPGWQDTASPSPSLDRLEITTAGDSVTALRPEAKPRTIALLPGEIVRDVQTRGRVGAVITSERLLATGTGGVPWMALPLEAEENTAEGFASSRLVLFVTAERVIIFDSDIPRFLISDLPAGERVDDQAVLPDATVYVTRDRAVGYSLGSTIFRDMLFAPGERVRRLKISQALISVVTSKRNLVFQSTTGQWMQHSLSLEESGI